MSRLLVRAATLSIALAALATLPVAAQVIPKGVDYWRTPAGGTKFEFPKGDVESLCKVKPTGQTYTATLRGIPAQGSDWDSAVTRLVDAKFDASGAASTRVQFSSLAMISEAPITTPCGTLIWTARLAKSRQPITPMKILKTANIKGGIFHADLALRVEMQANDAASGTYVGSLFYDVKLGDPTGGTPWSFGPTNAFRPGMTDKNNCVAVLRQKLLNTPTTSSHYYFISNLIAKGDCVTQPKE